MPIVWEVSPSFPNGSARPMTDAEFAQYELDQAAASVVPPPSPPPAADAVLGALASLDPSSASVADVVNAVRAALVESGASVPS